MPSAKAIMTIPETTALVVDMPTALAPLRLHPAQAADSGYEYGKTSPLSMPLKNPPKLR